MLQKLKMDPSVNGFITTSSHWFVGETFSSHQNICSLLATVARWLKYSSVLNLHLSTHEEMKSELFALCLYYEISQVNMSGDFKLKLS